MQAISVVSLDLTKNVFHVHALDEKGQTGAASWSKFSPPYTRGYGSSQKLKDTSVRSGL